MKPETQEHIQSAVSYGIGGTAISSPFWDVVAHATSMIELIAAGLGLILVAWRLWHDIKKDRK